MGQAGLLVESLVAHVVLVRLSRRCGDPGYWCSDTADGLDISSVRRRNSKATCPRSCLVASSFLLSLRCTSARVRLRLCPKSMPLVRLPRYVCLPRNPPQHVYADKSPAPCRHTKPVSKYRALESSAVSSTALPFTNPAVSPFAISPPILLRRKSDRRRHVSRFGTRIVLCALCRH